LRSFELVPETCYHITNQHMLVRVAHQNNRHNPREPLTFVVNSSAALRR
jgi:hypothetical protein